MSWPAFRIVMYDLLDGKPLTQPWVIWAEDEFDAANCYQILYALSGGKNERPEYPSDTEGR